MFWYVHHINSVEGNNIVNHFKWTMLNVIDKCFDRFFGMNIWNHVLVLASTSIQKFKNYFFEWDLEKLRVRDLLREACLSLTNENFDRIEHKELPSTVFDDDFFNPCFVTNFEKAVLVLGAITQSGEYWKYVCGSKICMWSSPVLVFFFFRAKKAIDWHKIVQTPSRGHYLIFNGINTHAITSMDFSLFCFIFKERTGCTCTKWNGCSDDRSDVSKSKVCSAL